MKTITSDFKNNVKLFGRQLDSIITFELNGETIELGNGDLNSITPHYSGSLFKSVMKQLDVDSNVEIPEGTILNYQFGVLVDDEYEYIDFGNYVVKSVEKQEDTNSYLMTCYDKMLYSMKDYENMNITYPITIRDYIGAICTKLGLTFKNSDDTFANYNRQISSELYLSYNQEEQKWESLGYTFRDVLDELAQVTASTICINENDDSLEIRYINDTNDIIDGEYLKDVNVNFGQMCGPYNTIVLSRSGGSDKVYRTYPDELPEEERVAIEFSDNQIMNWSDRSDYLPDILDKITGLTFALNDFSSTGICYYDLCDAYTIRLGENDYYCVMLNDEISITQGLEENVYTEELETSITDYTKADKTDRKLNQTYLIVDKQNQQIQSVVSQTSEQNQKISSLTQRVGSLESEITEIADMTISGETTLGRIDLLENVLASAPIVLKIRPIVTNIDKLYPNTALYPSTSLYPKVRTIRFTNITTSEVFDYELPEGLLYYNSENYDEFYLNGNDETCHITKKCKYNSDGTIGLLSEEEIHNIEFPSDQLYLTDGNYMVELLGYGSAYIMTRLLGKNIYTDQFYTKVETNTKISQSATDILLTADARYSTIDTANSLSTRISQKASSIELVATDNQTSAGLTIRLKNENGTQIDSKSANITMSGLVKFTDLSNSGNTTINGANITTGIIKSSNYVADTSGTSINLSTGVIDTKNFKVNSSGSITATGGTIGGWTISNHALYTSSNNYYLGTSGITATIGDTSRTGIILKAGSNFGVNLVGNLYANSATLTNANVSGTITATGGSFTGTLNAGNSNYYIRIGSDWAKHPEVSGLNVGNGGINLYDNDIVRVRKVVASNSNLLLCSTSGTVKIGNTNSFASGQPIEIVGSQTYINQYLDVTTSSFYVRKLNGTRLTLSAYINEASSKKLKENIKPMETELISKMYNEVKDLKLYSYDYKKEYREEDRLDKYGFMIDDINDKNIAKVLDIESNDEYSMYSGKGLAKLDLILIKQLMNKIEKLEMRINNE